MLQLLIVPISEIKSCGKVPSFYMKIMNGRSLQSCSLTQSIKKAHFYFGQTELIKVGQGESSPSSPLGYAPGMW